MGNSLSACTDLTGMSGTSVGKVGVGLLSGVLIALIPAAPASASTRVEYTPTYTHGTTGSGPICGGTISGVAMTHPKAPGRATVYLTAKLRAEPTLTLTWVCYVPTTVHWVNTRTGRRGATSVMFVLTSLPQTRECTPIVNGVRCGTAAELRLNTGTGQIRSWITTRLRHIPGHARFRVF